MPPRRALATVAAVTLGATAIGAAVCATTRVFNVAEASPRVGRVSPVSTPAVPPIIEHRVIDVEDPVPTTAPAGSVPAGATAHEAAPTKRPIGTGTSPTVAPSASSTVSTVAPRHESEHHGEDD
jgi:hypothetical protein